MIGLVLVTHGRLAAEFITALEHVVGPQEAIEAICIGPDDMESSAQGHAEAIGHATAAIGRADGPTACFGGPRPNLAIT